MFNMLLPTYTKITWQGLFSLAFIYYDDNETWLAYLRKRLPHNLFIQKRFIINNIFIRHACRKLTYINWLNISQNDII